MQFSELSPDLAQSIRVIAVKGLHARGIRAPTLAQVAASCEEIVAVLEATEAGRDHPHGIVIDHTDVLLRLARQFQRNGEPNVACVFYALWVEHKLNMWLASLARARRWVEGDVEAMIRDTQHRAKVTWLLRSFGAPEVLKRHRDAIQQVMDRRNGFVHYKWRKHKKSDARELASFLEGFEVTVRYLRRYEAKAFGIIGHRKAKYMLSRIPV